MVEIADDGLMIEGGLPDDLTHCALSEVTGRVVLGTRRGELIVL